MIPEFPLFKKIELLDKEDVEKFTKKFPPYSDFNFTSMWSWDHKNEMQISSLNENLVVKFTDYITCLPFYSFLGINRVNETINTLLDFSAEQGLERELKLVTEDSIFHLDGSRFVSHEERDHFDYILSLELLSKYENSEFRGHASFCRRFVEEHGDCISTKLIDLNNPEEREHINLLTKTWAQNKVDQKKDLLPHLEDAVDKFFHQERLGNEFVAVGIFRYNELIAYTINEMINDEFSTCHFMKGNNSYKGIYSYLVKETSKILLEKGKKYINFEQDLGLKNLRQAKKTYNPVHFLKKYSIKDILN